VRRARQEITALHGERDKLKEALRRQPGQRLDLVARAEELSRQNQDLTAERGTLLREKASAEAKLEKAEEDLAAARTSLRKMIRRENT
jgi:chromosome segregation ATPase